MDFIFIEQLRLAAHIGIYPREKAVAQMLEVDLTVGIPAKAARNDDIADTISYADVISRLRTELTERRFNLLETLGEFIAQLLLDEFAAPWVKITINKPGVASQVSRVGVHIERQRITAVTAPASGTTRDSEYPQ